MIARSTRPAIARSAAVQLAEPSRHRGPPSKLPRRRWRGDQEVLRLVWAEMREGGRAAFGAPFTRLVHGRPKVSARQRRRGFGADVGPRWREGSANWTAADRAMAAVQLAELSLIHI